MSCEVSPISLDTVIMSVLGKQQYIETALGYN